MIPGGQFLLVRRVSPAACGLTVGPSVLSVCLLQKRGEGAGMEKIVKDFIGIAIHGWALPRLGSA